jgi:DNA polymerase-3 subunit beta
VLLATDQGRLKLVATDLMIATTCWIGATVEEEGSITVPARLLTDFVSSLPNEKVDLTVGDRGRQLHILCARNDANMAGGSAEDFPPVPSVEDGFALRLDPKQFKRQIGIIDSMTRAERRRPDLIDGSRKRRIAAGAGLPVQDVSRLLKQHWQLAKTMKHLAKGGGMQRLLGAMRRGSPPPFPRGRR